MTWLVVAASTAAMMEPWAAWVHRRVWHGALWRVHRTHHRRGFRWLEGNDALSVLHAPVAAASVIAGCLWPGLGGQLMFGVGVGMTAFGAAYVVVHDGFVHGRLPVGWLERFGYFRQLRAAHLAHHRANGGPFGLFWF
ncbi:MAG: beta-carotene hydroxylase [Myxococcota bacterium]